MRSFSLKAASSNEACSIGLYRSKVGTRTDLIAASYRVISLVRCDSVVVASTISMLSSDWVRICVMASAVSSRGAKVGTGSIFFYLFVEGIRVVSM